MHLQLFRKKGEVLPSPSNHFADTLDLKIRLTRKMIAKFCQNDKVTPNQDRISPSNHASNRNPAVIRTIKPKAKPRAVEVFIINYRIVLPKVD